jgi:hypothetical protein
MAVEDQACARLKRAKEHWRNIDTEIGKKSRRRCRANVS